MEPVTITQTKGFKAQQRPETSFEKKSEQIPIAPKDTKPDVFIPSKITKKDIGLMAITAVVVATPFAIIAAKGKKSLKGPQSRRSFRRPWKHRTDRDRDDSHRPVQRY